MNYETTLSPRWAECTNAIAAGCSDLYAPYLAVYIKSIQENASKAGKYDIVILESDISDKNKEKLLQTVEGNANISLRFYNVDALFNNINLHISLMYFSKHCYYRLAVGKIFSAYDKVLFTDIDLAVTKGFDVNRMFEIDMQGQPIAAVEEILWTKENRKGKIQLGYEIDDYIINKVKCSDKYFNTGVMIVDIAKFNNVVDFEKLLQIGLEGKFINQEQCTLNQVFDGQIFALPLYYNFEIYEGIFNSVQESYVEYMKEIDNAYIYHHLTNRKAWFFPDLPKASLWWEYARKTPFYEEILARMVDFKLGNGKAANNEIAQLRSEFVKIHFPNINTTFATQKKQTQLLFVLEHMIHFRLKKFSYALKKAFAFGKKHQKYQQKYDDVKGLIKDANKFRKTLYKVLK